MKLDLGFQFPLPSPKSPKSSKRVNLTLGKLFKLVRKKAKESQSQFARRLGVSKQFIKEIESDGHNLNHPDYDQITQDLIDCFELDPEWVDFVRTQEQKSTPLLKLQRRASNEFDS
ncbi:MAG: helix-turn-helix transcriptional regulator [Roseofilum sp. SID3]|uniref:helix-turn-helix domain-containing protein n=1 Tax=Roseofilum sp. SID3 TaxID=2821499 RepID=UPI001B0C1335|nr:helix-turn-helix transcriptional regulator [Roseofilum sp. SID3]MBP0015310.1 helix-turn-helix transcriptional regulator [Roseofilum sp. SID3]